MTVRLLLLAAMVSGSAASAAPLCRDSKGLFTPCPRTANSRARTILTTASAKASEATLAAEPKPAAARPSVRRSHRAKLCRDTKGLFTPCAR